MMQQIGSCYFYNKQVVDRLGGQKGVSINLVNLRTQPDVADAVVRQGLKGWHMNAYDIDVTEVFPSTEVVYLSPNAELPLESVEKEKVYVIGGIVDRAIVKVCKYILRVFHDCLGVNILKKKF
jgi:Trm5-related predicted tRNA methylase